MAIITVEAYRVSGASIRESFKSLDSLIEFLKDSNNAALTNIEFNGDRDSLLGKVNTYASYILSVDELIFPNRKNCILSFSEMLRKDSNYI